MQASSEPVILIVDDSPANLDVLCNLLMGGGFEVAVATDGPTAIELAVREPPTLILLDISLPGIDGFETLRRLQDEPATRSTSVIFMTAHADAATRLRGLRAGAVDFVSKPFEADEILARVKVHVELRALNERLAESNALLLDENRERAAAEAALQALTRDLEQRVAERTADLAGALTALQEAKAELRRANGALAAEAEQRARELRELRERLEAELGERERGELERAALQEEIISIQRASLAELSTPVIPITDATVVMPMIGTMNEERAQQMLEAALAAVHERSTRVVIIDVTGLRLVDDRVASTLVRTADALRLLGAQAVLTGVRGELAQALIALEVDLGDVVIRGTVQGGIAYALGRAEGGPARGLSAPRGPAR